MPKATFNIVYMFKKISKLIPSLLCVSLQNTAFPPPALVGIKAVSCVLYDKLQHIDALISPPQKASLALQLPVTFST